MDQVVLISTCGSVFDTKIYIFADLSQVCGGRCVFVCVSVCVVGRIQCCLELQPMQRLAASHATPSPPRIAATFCCQ